MSWNTKTHITSVTGASGDSDVGQDGHLYLKISRLAAQRGHARSSFCQVTEKQTIHEISTVYAKPPLDGKRNASRLIVNKAANPAPFRSVGKYAPECAPEKGGRPPID
ncbi:hypothetical protein CIHG_02298 [Coccidioides immitis H538.4]|uniref:Uncharacterized protein n=2 Tax=Coccidioides immitis TaxID=5501 RepID=A0A0J8RKN8_COCIT|nr:hypothetical protein CIRG_00468 [Coccidioides immitis RMSCC 2394]KMU84514.1 hypothetical protein CIHG_02298 [Coccidioides immitis H538.4]